MNPKWIGSPALVVLLLVLGCRSQELSRNGAKDILNRKAAGSPDTEMTISFDQANKLLFKIDSKDRDKAREAINFDDSKPCLPDPSDVRIMTGQSVVCTGYIPPEVTRQHPGVILKLRKPLNWSVFEVTGISDDSKAAGDKLVEYKWHYDLSGLPKSVAEILTPTIPHEAKALLRRYDDGWRFVEFR